MNADIAKRLLEFRKANGYSQEDLAEKLGVSRQAISNWERNESSPDTDNLIALAQLYNVSIDELLKGSSQPEKNKADEKAEETADESSYSESNKYDNYKDGKSSTHISFKDGVHVHNEKDHVDIGWDGIHVETENGDSVHMNREELHNHIHQKIEDSVNNKNKMIWLRTLLPIFAVAFYLIVGFACGGSGWGKGWIVFLLIPIIESAITAVQKKAPSSFCYPVFATFLYLFFGFFLGVWHPTWVVFITIPAFYAICSAIKKTSANETETNYTYTNGQTTYYTPQGANVVDETKTKTKKSGGALTTILLTIICAITIVCVVAIGGAFSFMKSLPIDNIISDFTPVYSTLNYNDNAYLTGEGTCNNVSGVNIEWVSGKINMEHYDGDSISFKDSYSGNDDYTMRYKVENNTLYIKFCKPGLKLYKDGTSTINKDLTVLVPKEIDFSEIDIETVSADVVMQSINANQFKIEYVSGNVTATGNYNIIDAEGVSGMLNIHNNSNSFTYNIETVSGNCKLYLPENTPGFTCNFEAISGNVSTYEFDGFRSTKSFNDATHTYKNGINSIDFEAVSGNLEILKNS